MTRGTFNVSHSPSLVHEIIQQGMHVPLGSFLCKCRLSFTSKLTEKPYECYYVITLDNSVYSSSCCNAVVAPLVHFIISNRMIISGICAVRAVRVFTAVVYPFDTIRLVVTLAVDRSGGSFSAHVFYSNC